MVENSPSQTDTMSDSDDSDYVPGTESEEDAYEEVDEEEVDEEEGDEEEDEYANEAFPPTIFVIPSAGHGASALMTTQAFNKRAKITEPADGVTKNFSKREESYWQALSDAERDIYIAQIEQVRNPKRESQHVPLRFKILKSDISASAKALVLTKIDHFNTMPDHTGEYFKLRNWLTALDNLPLGVYKPLPIDVNHSKEKAVEFMHNVRHTLDATVYGHTEAKDQILRILAQWISNPDAKGHCIGIQGPMGVGKTQMVKDGLSKALGLPFAFVPLGGASDGALLEGHSFTYEGSSYGKIGEVLMKAKCMNPIIFFDELDKVSSTSRGEEVFNILTHLTDSTQNDHFCDRYFGEIDMNLSKALMIFTYNDESSINPILKDRMITIRVPGYSTKDKLIIARDHLIPKILSEYKMQPSDIVFSDNVISVIISKVGCEEGVRNLKRGIESIVSWINMYMYLPPQAESGRKRTFDDKCVKLPVVITSEHIEHLLNRSDIAFAKQKSDIINTMYL